jgi:hypothetical protein
MLERTIVYKVTYYANFSNKVVDKNFKDLHEATEFCNSLPINSVLEVKLYPDNVVKKEDRT